jgi:hypothetical protein
MDHPATKRRRRVRDRLIDRAGTENPRLKRYELSNLMLLVDDDLRETALALGGIESFLARALALLEKADVGADELAALADDGLLSDRLDYLGETLGSLRLRVSQIAEHLR